MNINFENSLWRREYLDKIRKDKARKLFNKGITIYLLGKNLNPTHINNKFIKACKEISDVNFDDLLMFEKNNLRNKWDGNDFYYYIIRKEPKKVNLKGLFFFLALF